MLLTAIVFAPLIGSLVVAAVPKDQEKAIKAVAIFVSGIELLLTLYALAVFDFTRSGEMQFEVVKPWIPQFGVTYHLGVDGISLPLVVLTSLLTFLSVLYSVMIKERPREYFALFLLLAVGMQGVFVALDYFLFYVFWEVSLVPMYFLIGIWGGPQKEFAAIKFFLYTLVGSVAMLIAILAIYFNTGSKTLDILVLQQARPFAENPKLQLLCFLGFFLAFAIKLPLFPFHTWLPLAHVEAPTAGSVILAGVLLKMGGYGLIRIALPTFPEAAAQLFLVLATLALISVIYGAMVAMAQTDLKRMIANSSINHMGYVMLGIAATSAAGKGDSIHAALALNGATLQMITHGLITGALFLLVGVIYERTHNRDMTTYGGLGVVLPKYSGVLTFFAFASLGLPSLAGFVSEFMVFIGSFKIIPFFAGPAVIGVVITAAFFLLMIQRMLLGEPKESLKLLPDMNRLELACLIPLAVLTIYIGIMPAKIIALINAPISLITKIFTG